MWRNLLKCLPSTSPNSFLISQPDPAPAPPPSSSTSASSAVVFNTNYNSLYDVSSSLASSTSTFSTATAVATITSSSDSDSGDSLPPDFATVLASQRFFFSSPGRSNSISDSHDKVECRPIPPPLEGGVAVNKYSPDPHTDFKKSMEEMIEARRRRRRIIKDDGARAEDEWDYLNQLLTCYLTLNPEHAHKYIISAFADIVVHLLSSEDVSPQDYLAGG
ncbi:Transcription repressor OFP12 [Linum grandiflorum]